MALLAGLASAPAAAQSTPPPSRTEVPDLTQLTLEELVGVDLIYAASRRPQAQREAPSAVTIVNADEIRRHGYRTLAEILRSVPSFYVTDDRNYSYVGVRGFGRPGDYSTRVLLLVDGLRMNDAIYDMAFVAADFLIDTDLIERVEIVRGPSASVYGNSAFFAVINVVTKRGRDLRGVELTASAASFGSYAGRASYGRRWETGLDLMVSASAEETDGQRLYYPAYDTPETNRGVTEGTDGESSHRVIGSVSKGGLSFLTAHASRQKAIPTGAYGSVFNDPGTRTWDDRTFVSLTYERPLAKGADVLARVHYGRYDYRGAYVYELGPGGTYRDFASGEWLGVETNATWRAGARHLLTLGGEYLWNIRQDQGAYYDDPSAPELDVRHRSRRWGVYLQDELRLATALRLNLGVRQDAYGTFGHQTSPRLGLVYTPTSATSLKALYGRAFRAPNDYELHYYVDTDPGLGAEQIETVELVAERLVGLRLRLTASAFSNRIDHLIELHGGPESLGFRNGGRIDSRGIELAAEAKGRSGARGRVSYAFQSSREHATGEWLSNSPRHLVKLATSVPLAGQRLSAAVDGQYASARRTLAGRTDGFFLAHLTLLARRLGSGMEARASIHNLTGTRYADPGSEEHVQDVIPQDGRSFRFALTWRF